MSIKNNISRFIITVFLFVFFRTTFAQDVVYQNKNIGFNIGANFAFGTHFQRLGINFNLFYVNKIIQTNSEIRVYFSFKNLGPKIIYNELVLAQGLTFGYGSKQNFYNPFINSVSNQTGYKNSVAYSYNYYFNKIKTKQVTGIAAFQFGDISFITENDILAKPILDRFRTGAFLIQYQYKDIFQAAINCTMWTGRMGRSVDIDHRKIYTKCYIDTSGGVYPKISHGLLSAQFKYNLGFSQNVQANVGVDAEQVRNAVQNRFIHNMRWVPKKLNKTHNCHIPMVDRKGEQYLFKEGQKIKKPVLYWNVFSNANLFY